VRHILISCGAEDDATAHEAAEAEAATIREQLVGGGDFVQLAQEKSSCPSKDEGGNLGDLSRGKTVPEFEQAAFSQAIDEIGPVVKTQFGYHIIQVTGKQDAGKMSKDEVSDDLRQHLEQDAKGRRFHEFIQSLRANATIEYGDPTGGIIIP